ncbi:MAG: hypothetical protein Kow0099_10520 [Candidatus Abyssubacteria bacterium]
MAIFRNLLYLLTIPTLIALTQSAAHTEQTPSLNHNKYMFIDEVKPGMKGYGLTVFSGAQIEKFDVEVISVLYGISPGSDLILARVAGGPLEKTGVIAGMSGSPIYVEGRIIGALAYSWAFSKEPIAGITPIKEMLRILEYKTEKGGWSTGPTPASSGWANTDGFSVKLPAAISDSAVMRPIMTPVVFSGFSREATELLRPQLEGWGIVPVTGGSFSENLQNMDAPFEEGAAVGVQLIRGDMSASAIGTLTVKEGDKVLAFGHPFMLSGSVDMPMTTAYVHTVLPSLLISSKVGTALRTVGSLTQDRDAGIAGILGKTADMVPLKLSARREGSNKTHEYEFEIVRNRQLFPPLTAMALSSSFTQVASAGGEFTAKVHYEIEVDGFPIIRNDDFVSGLSGFPSLASLGVFRDLSMLLTNQLEELSVKSVSMQVEVREAIESAEVTALRLHKEKVRPGDELELKVFMKPYKKDLIEKRFSLQVPEHFPEGVAYLHVSAAPQTAMFERMRSPFHFRPTTVEKLIQLVDEDYPGNRLDIRLLVTDPGIVIDGQEMSALPSSVFSVIAQTKGKEPMGVTRASVLLEKHVSLDFEVSGSTIIPITIDRKAR